MTCATLRIGYLKKSYKTNNEDDEVSQRFAHRDGRRQRSSARHRRGRSCPDVCRHRRHLQQSGKYLLTDPLQKIRTWLPDRYLELKEQITFGDVDT